MTISISQVQLLVALVLLLVAFNVWTFLHKSKNCRRDRPWLVRMMEDDNGIPSFSRVMAGISNLWVMIAWSIDCFVNQHVSEIPGGVLGLLAITNGLRAVQAGVQAWGMRPVMAPPAPPPVTVNNQPDASSVTVQQAPTAPVPVATPPSKAPRGFD